MMRAKFKVMSVEVINATSQKVTMMAVTEAPFDEEGKSDDNSFARWTPTGTITMMISNPDLMGKIKVGQKFYTDFNEAPEAAPAAEAAPEAAPE